MLLYLNSYIKQNLINIILLLSGKSKESILGLKSIIKSEFEKEMSKINKILASELYAFIILL